MVRTSRGRRRIFLRKLPILASAFVALALIVGPLTDATATSPDIVLYASDVTVSQGDWTQAQSSPANPTGTMSSTDLGWSAVEAPARGPAHYFEIAFQAPADTVYRVWVRLRGANDSKWNDSVWVQFSDGLTKAGLPIYRIGTSSALLVNLEGCGVCGVSGWGWRDASYWLKQSAKIKFATAGLQTIRVQTREDGVSIDQIVLSPVAYLEHAPGPDMNDTTIVPKQPPTPPPSPEPYEETRNAFFEEQNALPPCADNNVGTVCKQRTVRLNSQKQINIYTEAVASGDDPDNNDYISYDVTTDMAKIAIPTFTTRVAHRMREDLLSATATCLQVGNGRSSIWETGTPWVIGDYPSGTYEVVQAKANVAGCNRSNNLVPINRAIGGTTAREWPLDTVGRMATKKLGGHNKLTISLGDPTAVDAVDDPDGGCGPGCTTYLFTWDVMWDASSMGHYSPTRNVPQSKTYGVGVDGPTAPLFVQPQVRGICKDAYNSDIPGCDLTDLHVGTVNLRHHAAMTGGGYADWSLQPKGNQYCSREDCSPRSIGSDVGYEPQQATYLLPHNRIARHYVFIEAKFDDYDKTSFWIHDEEMANPVLVQDDLLLSFGPDAGCQASGCTPQAKPNRPLTFEVWYDTSSYGNFSARDEDGEPGYDPLISWISNLAVVRGLTRAQVDADYITRRPAPAALDLDITGGR